MDCIIYIEAGGNPRYDGMTKPFSGPVRTALRHRTKFYNAVFQHLRECKKCDPNNVLRAYLKSRNTPKHKGLISGDLEKLAAKYQHNFDIDGDIQQEFAKRTVSDGIFWHCVSSKPIDWSVSWIKFAIHRWKECGGWEGLNALDDVWQKSHVAKEGDLKEEAVAFLLKYHRKYDKLPPDDELENLMAMVDVMGT